MPEAPFSSDVFQHRRINGFHCGSQFLHKYKQTRHTIEPNNNGKESDTKFTKKSRQEKHSNKTYLQKEYINAVAMDMPMDLEI